MANIVRILGISKVFHSIGAQKYCYDIHPETNYTDYRRVGQIEYSLI